MNLTGLSAKTGLTVDAIECLLLRRQASALGTGLPSLERVYEIGVSRVG